MIHRGKTEGKKLKANAQHDERTMSRHEARIEEAKARGDPDEEARLMHELVAAFKSYHDKRVGYLKLATLLVAVKSAILGENKAVEIRNEHKARPPSGPPPPTPRARPPPACGDPQPALTAPHACVRWPTARPRSSSARRRTTSRSCTACSRPPRRRVRCRGWRPRRPCRAREGATLAARRPGRLAPLALQPQASRLALASRRAGALASSLARTHVSHVVCR